MNTVKLGRTEDEEDPVGNKNKKNPSQYAGTYGGADGTISGYRIRITS